MTPEHEKLEEARSDTERDVSGLDDELQSMVEKAEKLDDSIDEAKGKNPNPGFGSDLLDGGGEAGTMGPPGKENED